MHNEAPGATRQRPAGTAGRSRDAGRDKLIQDAVLGLVSELGSDAVSMEAVAARAGVSKATVYRRWAALGDLILDATDTLTFPARAVDAHAGPLRDDLVDSIVGATGCLDPDRQRMISNLLEASRRGPSPVETLRARFVQSLLVAINKALARAISRGELHADHPAARPLDPESIELAVVLGLLFNFPHLTGRPVAYREFERIVDEALLPLLRARR